MKWGLPGREGKYFTTFKTGKFTKANFHLFYQECINSGISVLLIFALIWYKNNVNKNGKGKIIFKKKKN